VTMLGNAGATIPRPFAAWFSGTAPWVEIIWGRAIMIWKVAVPVFADSDKGKQVRRVTAIPKNITWKKPQPAILE